MKTGRLAGPGRLAVEEADPPEPGTGELVFELAGCGVCGTDLEKLKGNYRTAGKLGHEPVGVVTRLGSDIPGVAVGDRVFVHHHVPCGTCQVCRRGDFTFCPSYSATNIDPGGFSEAIRVPRENVERGAVHRIPPEVSWDVGTLVEPAACALTALRKVEFHPGDSVAILGLGPVGLLYGALAHSLGASWILGSEFSGLRRAAAERLGVDQTVEPHEASAVEKVVRAETGGFGVDRAVVATGATPAIDLGTRLPRRGGTLNLFGLPESGSRLGADLQELYLRGVRVIPTYATTERDIEDILGLVASGRLRLDGLVTHRYTVSEISEAFGMAGRPTEAIKVVVTGPAYRR